MPRPRIYRSTAEKQAAYRERKRKRQPVYHWHKSDEWETPTELFAELHREFSFTLDVAALPYNAKCRAYFTPGCDGLKQVVEWRLLDESAVWPSSPQMGEEGTRECVFRCDCRLSFASAYRYALVA
jgi:hypothetical protein